MSDLKDGSFLDHHFNYIKYVYIYIYTMRNIGTIIVQRMRQTFLKYPNHIKFMFGFIISRFLLMNKNSTIYIYTYTPTYTPTYTHTYTYISTDIMYIYILSTVYRFPYFTGLLPRSQIYQIWLSKEVNNHHCFPLWSSFTLWQFYIAMETSQLLAVNSW